MAFTAEFAAQLGRKSGIARRERAERLKALQSAAIQSAEHPVQLVVQAHIPPPPEASRVRERLDTLDSLMAKAETDREWDNLSRAYERMFKVWAYLTQTPGPGNLRPTTPRHDKRLSTQATFDSPLLPAEPIKPQVYDGPENG